MADHQPEWESMVESIMGKFKEAVEELRKTWEEIGYTKDTRAMYYEQACKHFNDLFDEMVEESHLKKQLLLENIQTLMQQLTQLRTELHVIAIAEDYEHVPLHKVEQILHTDVQNLEGLKNQRLIMLKELLRKEHEMCKRLGRQKLNINTDVLPTKEELDSLLSYIQKQEDEMNHIEGIFTEMGCSIIQMMKGLDIAPSSSFEHLIYNNPADFVLNTSNMTKLKEFRDKLRTQVEETQRHVEKMKEDLLALWKYLNEPIEACELFLNNYPGYGSATINALNAELKRCKEKRKENISKYVSRIRSELLELWSVCKYSEKQRNDFVPFHSNIFTEDLLTLHELEAEKLRKFYNENSTIFELLEQRDAILLKIKELLQRENNPDRFHNRGGQLLMEEKERKATQKKLPKIEMQLRQLISEYEAAHDEMFTINGISLENLLAESWENINNEKESIKKARKEAKDKSVKKSPLSCSRRTPGMSHLSIRRNATPGMSKRKLFTPSPNTSAKRRNKTEKNKPTVSASKVKRSGKLPKIIIQKVGRSSKDGKRKKGSVSPNCSITDTTYKQFQVHMTDREELHSSLLPEHILKNSTKINIKAPVRTPAKPLRKNLTATATPTHSSARKPPHSPRIANTPKLAAAPSNLPFIF